MSKKAERINGWAAHAGCCSSNGFICLYRTNHPRCLVIENMLALSTGLIFAWVVWALTNNVDDDNDGPGGGIMSPVYEGA